MITMDLGLAKLDQPREQLPERGEVAGPRPAVSPKNDEPCLFCRREIPCECNGQTCMCSCGRCMAPYPWELG